MIILINNNTILISKKDKEIFSKNNWAVNKAGYVYRRNKSKTMLLHREIMAPIEKNMVVDHINGNKLDNRRINLRICTHAQNMANSKMRKNNQSGYRGVYWNKEKSKYQVGITIDKKVLYLGRFYDIKKAAEAYDKAAILQYGNFAVTNF